MTKNASHNKATDGLWLALRHIEAQHAVWDYTDIPPGVLLDILAKNIRSMIDQEQK